MPNELSFNETKEQYRRLYKDLELKELAESMQDLQESKVRFEKAMTEINAQLDVLRLELIPTKMEAEGITNVNFEEIGRITITADAYVRLGDKAEFKDWAEANNMGDLFQPTINSSTLKAWAKRRVKQGEEVPECVIMTPFQRASITRT